ncbi:Protein of unknown function [Pyronema omphalodes CBS 100304]|uniref:Uncharacterized protein n=1 Tax=Pyronema omphalodes (strain CBS 100304) TaxID=1076935 RepID=U4LLI4_PYROM|nr:Protein of unknown function [Pyronema omphalodes CBS 100304]
MLMWWGFYRMDTSKLDWGCRTERIV